MKMMSVLQDGRKYTNTSNLFGSYVNDIDNSTIYKSVLDQYYSKELTQNDFFKVI